MAGHPPLMVRLVPITSGSRNIDTYFTILDKPAPDSIKIAESLVLLEFVADLFPDSGLLPKDPVERAKVRLFIDTFAVKYGPHTMPYLNNKGEETKNGILAAFEALQSQLGRIDRMDK